MPQAECPRQCPGSGHCDVSRHHTVSAPGRSRTCDLSLRRRLLYPLSYWGAGAVGVAARRPRHILSGPAGGPRTDQWYAHGLATVARGRHHRGSHPWSGAPVSSKSRGRVVSDPDAPEGATPESGNPTPGRHSSRADAGAGAGKAAEPSGPKRKGKVKKRHTVGRVLLVSSVVLALVTGLGTIYLYRHLNSNLDVIDIEQQLTNRPEKKHVEGPHEPVNVLVMGSDDRDAPGNNIDNLTGGGKRSDTTILLHLSADRKRAYGVSIPRDSLVDRAGLQGRRPQHHPRCQRRDVERGVLGRWPGLHGAAGRDADRRPGRPLRGRRLRRVQGHGRRHRRGPGLHPRAHRSTRPTASTCRPAPASSRASRPSTTCGSGTSSATVPTSAG